jgi:uncharacterized protein with GYD domain
LTATVEVERSKTQVETLKSEAAVVGSAKGNAEEQVPSLKKERDTLQAAIRTAKEEAEDATMAQFLLSLASKGNVRTTTVRVFPEAEIDKIVCAPNVCPRL